MVSVPDADAVARQWRITVKSNDETKVDYSEPFHGTERDARRRAWIMWARTSYVVNTKTQHRDVYACLEVWDGGRHEYRMVKEKRGRYPKRWEAPGQS